MRTQIQTTICQGKKIWSNVNQLGGIRLLLVIGDLWAGRHQEFCPCSFLSQC